MTILEFEKPIYEIEEKIKELKEISESSGMDVTEQINTFEKQAMEYKKELYSKLTPSQRIQIARHADRPTFLDYVKLITEDFTELHGDREGTDDRAIIGGVAKCRNCGNTKRENYQREFNI